MTREAQRGIGAGELEGLLAGHREAFLETFGPGTPPDFHFSPGRVNLMGAHLDYNGGPVMPMTIDCGTFVGLRERSDGQVLLRSTTDSVELRADLGALPVQRSGDWVDYPLGVILALKRKATATAPGSKLPGFEVLFGGNLPIGAGLSSSASICLGMAIALDRAWDMQWSDRERVEAALWSEREFVGVHCGIMDPFAVGFARPSHLLWLDCKDESIEHIPMDADAVCVAVADTGVRRALAQGEFNKRVAECAEAYKLLKGHVPGATCLRDIPASVLKAHAGELPSAVQLRAMHVIEEVARANSARDSLLNGDLGGFGAQMSAAHASLDKNFEVSVPELDVLVDTAVHCPGVFGSRLTGAGFGGCTVILLEPSAKQELRARLSADFSARFGSTPTIQFFQAGGGPRRIELD